VKITIPFLLVSGIGALCLWCGITDRNPVAVVHAVFTGAPIPGKGSGTTTPPSVSPLPNTAPDSGPGPGPKVPPTEPPLPGVNI
jgi:hypothetical protein